MSLAEYAVMFVLVTIRGAGRTPPTANAGRLNPFFT
jgi:hypothetical protein